MGVFGRFESLTDFFDFSYELRDDATSTGSLGLAGGVSLVLQQRSTVSSWSSTSSRVREQGDNEMIVLRTMR